jgi:hypothetical protein
MKHLRHPYRLRACVIAVHGALGLLGAAQAQTEPSLNDLVLPKSSVEMGAASASGYSAKAYEFSGRTDKGPGLFGNVDLRGGSPYDSHGVTRWQIRGAQLGSQAPAVDLMFAEQGRFRLKFGFDQLLRNQSDSYRTPYLGVGTTSLRLPSNWIAVVVPRVNASTPNARGLSPEVTSSNALVAGISTAPTAAQAAAAASLQAADLPAFAQVDLFSKRSRFGLSWDQQLGAGWSLTAIASREHKSCLKALGAQSRATGGDSSSILPTLIDQDDNKLHFGLSYAGEALHLQAAYEDSMFVNHAPSVSWNLWAAPKITAELPVGPSNRFRKWLFSGNYQVNASTSVTGTASYSRASQNEPFLSDSTALLVPAASAQALIVNESASFRLMHKANAQLGLSANYLSDLRDNRTPVNTYGYYDINNAATGTSPFAYLYPGLTGLGQNFNFNANRPYSKRALRRPARRRSDPSFGHARTGSQPQHPPCRRQLCG